MSMITDAAIAAWKGDLEPAHKWLRAMQRTVRYDDCGALTWQQDGYLPAGGLQRGQDPINGLVVLLLATGGPLILTDSETTKPLFREVNDRWMRQRKADEAAALEAEECDGRE